MNDEVRVSLVGWVWVAKLGRGRILSKRNVLSELGQAPSVRRRKCISPIAVEESLYVYAVEDIWVQITGVGNVDVEKVYRV